MNKRHTCILGLFLGLLLMAGCTQPKPAPVITSSAEASQVVANVSVQKAPLRFQLRQAPNKNLSATPREPFVVTLDNCQGDAALVNDSQQTLAITTKYELDTEVQTLDLSPYRAEMEASVRQAYGLSDIPVRNVADTLTLQIPSHSRAQFSIRWDELWDSNTLDVLQGEQVIASVPVRVLSSAKLVTVTSQIEACLSAANGTPSTVGVPLVVGEEKTPAPDAPRAKETLIAPELTGEPGSDESMALVRDYLQALNTGDTRSAYDMLHKTYQERLKYQDFAQSYSRVVGIEIHTMETTKVDRYHEIVRVGMTIATEAQGQTTYTDYFGTYDIVVTRGKPPYQRTISNASLHPLIGKN